MRVKWLLCVLLSVLWVVSTAAQDVPRVALMLPLEDTRAEGNDFTEFYRGYLLGLEEIKLRGKAVDVTVWDTAGSAERVFNTVVSEDFLGTDLIIGPVYERELGYAVQFAELMSIPIVSPLATLRETDSELLYQMAPDSATKYDKLRELWSQPEERKRGVFDWLPRLDEENDGGEREATTLHKNIILVSSEAGNDQEFELEMEVELQGVNVGRFTIDNKVGAQKDDGATRLGTAGDIATLIDWDGENIFVVLGAGELAVDDALATISSSYSNASARLNRMAEIKVVGSSRWAQYGRIDRNLFFKLGVRFVSSYYIDRGRADVKSFDERFLEAYGKVPTRAAFRGWDAALVFVGALFENGWGGFDEQVRRSLETAPTGVKYKFGTSGNMHRKVNVQWQLVEFSDNFNVNVR